MNPFRSRGSTPLAVNDMEKHLAFAAVLLSAMLAVSGLAQQSSHWVGTWASSPQVGEAGNAPPAPGFTDATLRQIVHVSIGGTRLRVRFSNAFGTNALTITSAHVALSAGGSAIRSESDKPLAFHGGPSVSIPSGALILSDPLDFDLAPLSDLAVTIHVVEAPNRLTVHPGSRETSYLQAGDAVSASDLPAAVRTEHWWFLNGIDVLADRSGAAVATLGDSITDGRGSTTDKNNRWPDELARRLAADKTTADIGVLNEGIGGNRLLQDGLGPSALARLDRDVLAQSGLRWLIVLEGINDLGTRASAGARNEPVATAQDLIAAYEQIILRAHARDIRVYGATILPCGASFYFSPEVEADRQTINQWIRTSGKFDGVIDSDVAMRDPQDPARLWAGADSGDHLHPSTAGYKMLAEAIDLRLFAQSADPPPVQMTAQEDHRRIMDLLHIKSLRPGADPNHLDAPNAVNYNESKANPYPNLPDPLVLKNGKKVTRADVWWKQRRPQIVEDFDREIYGRVPADTPKVNWEVASTSKELNGGFPVVTKKLLGRVDNASYPLIIVDIQMTLTTPADAQGPVPVVLEFGFPGSFPGRGPGRAGQVPTVPAGPTWQQQLLSKGWGYAIIAPNSIQADNGAGLTQGIIGLVNKGQPRKLDDWGALRAWAWGASRALDYFETDKSVDARQVGIEGLSRYGKATLVTMAYDQRFAIAFVGSSGEGGAKLHRRNFGELVENVAGTGEYHWMAGNFLKYAGPLTWNDLPVDAHELIALCAPRPVFISAGSQQVEGGWVDAKGMFLAAVGAGSVYKLLGKKDLGATEFPAMETSLIDGEVAFRQHSGGHTTGPNWPTFLAFAARYIKSW